MSVPKYTSCAWRSPTYGTDFAMLITIVAAASLRLFAGWTYPGYPNPRASNSRVTTMIQFSSRGFLYAPVKYTRLMCPCRWSVSMSFRVISAHGAVGKRSFTQPKRVRLASRNRFHRDCRRVMGHRQYAEYHSGWPPSGGS